MNDTAAHARYGFTVPRFYKQCCFRDPEVPSPDPLALACQLDVFFGPNYKVHEYWQSLVRQAKFGVAAALARQAVLSAIAAMKDRHPIKQPDFVRHLMSTLQSALPQDVITKMESLALERAYPVPCALIAFAIGVKEAAKPNIITIEGGVITPLPEPGDMRVDSDTDWLCLV
ncbi:MAG TPA: hypothetical protein VNA25_03635 [Phycisphaerae bacterium]|nr:hypothetical protein [Phycisphaerae bacterium]